MGWTRRQLLRTLPVGLGVGFAGCNATGGGEETPTDTEISTQTSVSETAGTTPTNRSQKTHPPTTKIQPATEKSKVTPPNTSKQSTHTVEMLTELYFDPVGLFVEPGETVSFKNVSGAHSATAFHPEIETYSIAPERRIPRDASPWNTGMVNEAGAVRTVTFETVGTHDYFCIPHVHAGMVGRIIVGEPNGPATNSSNPYTSYYPLPDSERIVKEKAIPFDAIDLEEKIPSTDS